MAYGLKWPNSVPGYRPTTRSTYSGPSRPGRSNRLARSSQFLVLAALGPIFPPDPIGFSLPSPLPFLPEIGNLSRFDIPVPQGLEHHYISSGGLKYED